MFITGSKNHVAVSVRASHGKAASCVVWCPWDICPWRYDLFNMSRDLKRPTHWGTMQICGWELLAMCHHLGNFCDHRYYDGEDMFLICHMTSHDHMIKRLCEFISGSRTVSPHTVKHDLAMFGGHWPSVGGDTRYLILSRDHTVPRDWRIM